LSAHSKIVFDEKSPDLFHEEDLTIHMIPSFLLPVFGLILRYLPSDVV